ncbi:MAG: hypothetical protein NVS4B8_12980 [Herpetosiphon sp.]
MSRLHVALLQLPVPNNPRANVPLAGGYLKAYALAKGLLEQCDIDLVARSVSDTGGDSYVVDEVLRLQPQILGLSLYTWNSERSLHVAQMLKSRLPELCVVVGGPEVQPDNRWVYQHPAVDVAVIGEGEQTFAALLEWYLDKMKTGGWQRNGEPDEACGEGPWNEGLSDIPGIAYREGGHVVFTAPRAGLEDLQVIRSPYLEGYLPLRAGDIAFVECSRWCPYRCTFCLYGRNMGSKLGKRLFSLERVVDEVTWAQAQGVQAVHFVEANLNLLPYFRRLMERLIALNGQDDLPFYAELRGEHLSEEAVALLMDAGLRVAEVGLQSANPAALAAVERRTDLVKWASGTRRLIGAGAEVLLDVILGLPKDDAATVEQTIEWIKEQELGCYDVFMLQALPGTGLRSKAGEFGIEYQDRPPYYVLRTAQMDFETLRALRWQLKEGVGIDPQDIEGMPLLQLEDDLEQDSVPILRLVCDCSSAQAEAGADVVRQVGAHLTVFVRHWDAVGFERWCRPIAEANRTTHWDVVIEGVLPSPAVLRSLRRAWPHETGYLDRVAVFQQRSPTAAGEPVSPRWWLLIPWGTAGDPLAYEGIASLVWVMDGDRFASEHLKLERRGGTGLAIVDAEPAVREAIEDWNTQHGLLIWWFRRDQLGTVEGSLLATA